MSDIYCKFEYQQNNRIMTEELIRKVEITDFEYETIIEALQELKDKHIQIIKGEYTDKETLLLSAQYIYHINQVINNL